MVCPSCYRSQLRLSKFRSEDIGHLFFLRYPFRCRECGERSYANFLQALSLLQARRHKHSEVAPKSVDRP